MRVANNDKECVEFFDLCKEEAMASFNSDKMLVEKFIETPRHIEIQVIADRCGNTLYLPERECSIQRRNQKVLEEAPSCLIDPITRKRMGEEAVAMSRAVNYVSAGTVEMVVNPKKEFFFLEMNTRLQVEHPITELITGVDLVEQMLLAAAGKPLSIKQEDIKINGWATEARVYAEDPMKNFFPSIGRLSQYEEPKGEGVRVDSGILEGSQISVYYDPLIAKLCTWGPDRNTSLERMRLALDQYVIRGVKHNICLVRDVISHERYINGDLTTNYLAETYQDGFQKANLNDNQKKRLLSTTCILHLIRASKTHMNPCASNKCISTTMVGTIGAGHTDHMLFSIDQQDVNSTKFNVQCLDKERKPSEHAVIEVLWDTDFPVITINVQGFGDVETDVLQLFGTDEVTYQMQFCGTVFEVNALTEQQAKLAEFLPVHDTAANAKEMLSPMPGVIVHVNIKAGDVVVCGDELLTLEAMKMRNKLRSEVDGKIKSVKVKVGDSVEDCQILIEFE